MSYNRKPLGWMHFSFSNKRGSAHNTTDFEWALSDVCVFWFLIWFKFIAARAVLMKRKNFDWLP